jgi:hypothetical protein
VLRNNTVGCVDFGYTGRMLDAVGCHTVTLTNNLFSSGWFHVRGVRCNDFRVEHNTFFHGGIGCLMLEGPKDASWRIRNNIFLGKMHRGKDVAAVVLPQSSRAWDCDHNLYWQYRPKKNGPALVGSFVRATHSDNARTIEEAVKKFGVERHGKYASPKFVRHESGDFKLKPDSPAIGMAENGQTVGAQIYELKGK